MTAFGEEFSRTLVAGAAQTGVLVPWVLDVLALESGFEPFARNASGAAGLWQRMPTPCWKAPGVRLTVQHEPDWAAKGLIRNQRGELSKPYPCPAPHVQIADAFTFWRAMIRDFKVKSLTSAAQFYCLNLAPARMAGTPSDATVLYSHPSQAYIQNLSLDPMVNGKRKGRIEIGDLGPALLKARGRCARRWQEELAAAEAVRFEAPTG